MVVVDRELADAIRPVTTLSGGERFLVSLALALGLSTLASRRRKLASMFIDEGFGTLDPETLSVALGVLDALQASGTRVGIISHVSELKERLQARIVVQRRGDGTSTVRIEG
jgi:exonuclease SbcC